MVVDLWTEEQKTVYTVWPRIIYLLSTRSTWILLSIRNLIGYLRFALILWSSILLLLKAFNIDLNSLDDLMKWESK